MGLFFCPLSKRDLYHMAFIYNGGEPFDPATLLYLYPELQAYSNIVNIEQVKVFHDTVITAANIGNWIWSLSYLPIRFDETVYLADNRETANISDLNETIRLAMLAEGWGQDDIEQNAVYVPTIFRHIHLMSNNMFKFNVGANSNLFFTSECNLRVGDQIRIIRNGVDNMYSTVVDIYPDRQTFVLSNDRYTFTDFASSYELSGIRVYDPHRLASINFLRYLAANNVPAQSFTLFGSDFNAGLYKLLYPEARIYDDESAFLDYTGHLENQEMRIGRTEDLLTTLDPDYATKFQDLTVYNRLYLDLNAQNGFVCWNGQELYYATTDTLRTAAELSPSFQGLVTEWAIKTYIDRKYLTEAVFNDIIVNGRATFNNTVTMNGNNTVNGKTSFNETVWFSCNVDFRSPCAFAEDVTFNDIVTTEAPVNMHALLTTSGPIIANGRVDIYGDLAVHGPLDIYNDMVVHAPTVFDNLDNEFLGPVVLQSNVTFHQKTVFDGTDTEFWNPVTFHEHVLGAEAAHLDWTGTATFCNTLVLDGDVCVRAPMTLEQNAPLTVYGEIAIHADVVSTCNVVMCGPVTFSNSIEVLSNVHFGVASETVVDGTWTSYGEVIHEGPVLCLGAVEFDGSVTYCNGPVVIVAPLDVYKPTVFHDRVTFSNDVSFSDHVIHKSPVTFDAGTQFNAPLNIDAEATFAQPVEFVSDVVCEGQLDVYDDTEFHDIVIFDSNVTFVAEVGYCNAVVFEGPVIFREKIQMDQPTAQTQEAYFMSNVYAMSEFFFADTATFCNSAIFQEGAMFTNVTSFQAPAAFSNTAEFSDTATFTGPIITSDVFECSGVFTLTSNATFIAQCPITFSNDLEILHADMEDVTISNLSVKDLWSWGSALFSGSSVFTGPLEAVLAHLDEVSIVMADVSNLTVRDRLTSMGLTECHGDVVLTGARMDILSECTTFSSNVFMSAWLTSSNIRVEKVLSVEELQAHRVQMSNAQIHSLEVDENLSVTSPALFTNQTTFDGVVTFKEVVVHDASAIFHDPLIAHDSVIIDHEALIQDATITNGMILHGWVGTLDVVHGNMQNIYTQCNWINELFASNVDILEAHVEKLDVMVGAFSNVFAKDVWIERLESVWSSNDWNWTQEAYVDQQWTDTSYTSNAYIEMLDASNVWIEQSQTRLAKVDTSYTSNAYIEVISNEKGFFKWSYHDECVVDRLNVTDARVDHEWVSRLEGSNVSILSLGVSNARVEYADVDTLSNLKGATREAWIEFAYGSNIYVNHIDVLQGHASNWEIQQLSVSNADVRWLHCDVLKNDMGAFGTVYVDHGFIQTLHASNVAMVNVVAEVMACSNVTISNLGVSNAIMKRVWIEDNLTSKTDAVFDGTVTFNNTVEMHNAVMMDAPLTHLDTVATFLSSTQIFGQSNYIQNVSCCNVKIDGDIDVISTPTYSSNIIVNGAMLGPRIGIGPYLMPMNEQTVAYDPVAFSNVERFTVSKALEVGTAGITEGTIVARVHGHLQAQDVINVSDQRLKTNITHEISRQQITKGVYSAKVVSFEMKDAIGERKLGLIAQELEDVLPDAVKQTHHVDQTIDKKAYVMRGRNKILFIKDHLLEEGVELQLMVSDGKLEYFVFTNVVNIIDRDSVEIDKELLSDDIRVIRARYHNVSHIDQGYLIHALFLTVQELKEKLDQIRV